MNLKWLLSFLIILSIVAWL